jgi:hypothetical protein
VEGGNVCAERVDATNSGQKEPVEGLERLERCELLAHGFNDAEIQHLSALQLLARQHSKSLGPPAQDSRLEFARWLVTHGRLSEYIGCASDGQQLPEKALDASPREARISQTHTKTPSDVHAGELEMDSTKWQGLSRWSASIGGAWVRVRKRLNTLVTALGGNWCTERMSGNECTRRTFRVRDPYGSSWRHDPPHPTDNDIWYWLRYWHHG